MNDTSRHIKPECCISDEGRFRLVELVPPAGVHRQQDHQGRTKLTNLAEHAANMEIVAWRCPSRESRNFPRLTLPRSAVLVESTAGRLKRACAGSARLALVGHLMPPCLITDVALVRLVLVLAMKIVVVPCVSVEPNRMLSFAWRLRAVRATSLHLRPSVYLCRMSVCQSVPSVK